MCCKLYNSCNRNFNLYMVWQACLHAWKNHFCTIVVYLSLFVQPRSWLGLLCSKLCRRIRSGSSCYHAYWKGQEGRRLIKCEGWEHGFSAFWKPSTFQLQSLILCIAYQDYYDYKTIQMKTLKRFA